MEAADAPAVAALEAQCFSQPWSLRAFAQMAAQESACYLLLWKQGELAAVAGFVQALDEANLSNIMTAPEFRRQGLAGRLLDALLHEGRARAVSRFVLEVRASNQSAIGLYASRGFAPLGLRPGFYQDPPEAALMMELMV